MSKISMLMHPDHNISVCFETFFRPQFVTKIKKTSGRGRLWGPALGVVQTLHTDNKQHKENMKT